MNLLATYIHNLDPMIIQIPGTEFGIRWYGFAYICGFILGYLVLRWLASKKLYCIAGDKLGDFITSIAIFGVLIGGRVGSMLFYWLPRVGWDGFCADPFWVLRVWEGGMASHGGILGVMTVSVIYAYRHKLSSLAVMDGLAIVAPLGIFFGRMANFINGELYGRICSADNPIGMKFPQEINELQITQPAKWSQMVLQIQQNVGPYPETVKNGFDFNNWLIEISRSNEAARNIMGEYLHTRYPSQLFEAAAEGLIIFIVLFALRLIWKKAPRGLFCLLFCILYSLGRFVTEYYREPDAEMWQGLSRGQYLSFGIIALAFILAIPVARQIFCAKADK